MLESMEIEENDNSFIFRAKECDLVREIYEQVAITRATQTPSEDADDVQAMAAAEGKERDADDSPVSEEVSQVPINETDAEVSIGTEIPDLDASDELQTQEIPPSYQCIHEDPSTSSANLHTDDDHGIECKTISVEMGEQAMNSHLSLCSESNEIEEEKVPDTPTSIESLNHLHKKLLLLERKESGT
ncbi:hypothetical protein F0562_033480 [Nyssa sinensis]|uniref:Uncharacterized protein n=1 Tax=Nyssa sinensis TaxID=561372 RepID=A0A5J5AGQ3_9ASTE|nr:hypothetical protein F0562_033480 [Nyssa sinensis]